ncbi:heterokaryon incompatibility protein-domain-containing protein [Hypoxylon argillaceum]|nr:heterokaryon incompatibility protein-domain-containing protein [Hypoxylon argillaceum]
MEAFKGVSPHRPLNQNGKEIRIIKLLPNTFSAQVECELEHIALNPGADYEAVSYCWGDASITEPILLDGTPYPVTLNLLAGLRYLRREDSPRRLWVDSLCINQRGVVERSREILKMRDIYRLARSVLIWLGDYHPFTRLHVSVRPKPYMKDVAKSPNLICGDLVLPFPHLRAVGEYWVNNTDDQRIGLPPICPSLDRMRTIWFGHQSLVSGGEDSTLAQRLAWILALVAGRFHATDQRDIVYAILGLLNADPLPAQLLPDYSKSPAEVLVECASFIVVQSRILTILQYNSMQTEGLPTWVPDWRHDSWCPIVLTPQPHSKTHVRVLREIGALEVDMVSLTQVCQVGPRLEQHDSAANLINTWSNFFLEAEASLARNQPPVWGYSSFGKALWQLLLAFDLSRQELHEPGWHLGAAEGVPPLFFWEGGFSLDSERAWGKQDIMLEEILTALQATVPRKFLFRGLDDSIGIMCQPDVTPREGDMVGTVKGSYADFIFREYLDGYKIVGRCERSKRGDFAIGDTGLHRWAGTTHLYAFYEELWTTSDGRRTLIY